MSIQKEFDELKRQLYEFRAKIVENKKLYDIDFLRFGMILGQLDNLEDELLYEKKANG